VYFTVACVVMLMVYTMLLLFRENEESGADVSEKDDEIFFGPVGHTEKCVAVGVNEVAQTSHKLQPLSPLSAAQVAELCREAYTVAYRIEHDDSTKSPYSHAKTTGVFLNDVISKTISPVKDLMSNVAVACQNEHAGIAKLLPSHTETIEATSNDELPGDSPVKDLISIVACQIEHASSAKPLHRHVETTETSSSDEIPCDKSVNDLTSNVSVAYQNEICDTSVPVTESSETAEGSCDVELSSINQVDLALNVTEADRGLCVDGALSSSSFSNPTSGRTKSRRESFDNKPSSSNAFEGLLSSLGSAIPLIEPGCLKQDEQGVVKFTAAAANADAKCRSGIPAPSGLRRASSAKSAGIHSSGIPMKVLAVSHLFDRLCFQIQYR